MGILTDEKEAIQANFTLKGSEENDEIPIPLCLYFTRKCFYAPALNL